MKELQISSPSIRLMLKNEKSLKPTLSLQSGEQRNILTNQICKQLLSTCSNFQDQDTHKIEPSNYKEWKQATKILTF